MKALAMKHLCVFYRYANRWRGRRVQWIVCRECRRKLINGARLFADFTRENV